MGLTVTNLLAYLSYKGFIILFSYHLHSLITKGLTYDSMLVQWRKREWN